MRVAISIAAVSAVALLVAATPNGSVMSYNGDAGRWEPVAPFGAGAGSCVLPPGDGGVIVGLNLNGAPSCSRDLRLETVWATETIVDIYRLPNDTNDGLWCRQNGDAIDCIEDPPVRVGEHIYTDAGIVANSLNTNLLQVGENGTPVKRIFTFTLYLGVMGAVAAGTCTDINGYGLDGITEQTSCFVTPTTHHISKGFLLTCSAQGNAIYMQACCYKASGSCSIDSGPDAGSPYAKITVIFP